MAYNLVKTSTFMVNFRGLPKKLKRLTLEAMEVIKESPTVYQDKITRMTARKEEGTAFKFRVPGAWITYVVHDKQPMVTMLSVREMK
ncbi:MAG: hypothetical protein AB7P76_06860 [Candidatus Melainabacteria bacterium]